MTLMRSRWAAIGAAVAVTLGGGGFGLVNAGIDTGERPVTITVSPERVLDTRVDLGLTGPFTSLTPRDVQITGSVPVASGGNKTVVPADAVAVIVNVTIVNPSSGGFLALRPGGSPGDPSTSTVNFLAAGAIEPNAATVDLAPNGTIQVYVLTAAVGGTADVLVDIVGYTVDHTHDDRYYTENEVDTLIGAIPSGPAGPAGPSGPPGPAGPQGPAGVAGSYAHVIVVAESGGDFTTVTDAMAAIGTDPDYPAASDTERYLVWVAPGTYDGRVVMQSHVDIEGSGQGVTTLTSVTGAGGISPNAATVVGADNAELREISVEVTPPDPSNWSHAIYTDATTTFREVTARSTGGARARGMVVATGGAPLLIDVVVSATGASASNLGLDLFGATAFADGLFATASGGLAAKAIFLNNASSEVFIENVSVVAADGSSQTFGFEALNSSVSLEGYRATVTSAAGDLLGARCTGTDRFLKILDGTISASNSGGQARGVFGSDCSIELRDMVIDAFSDGSANAQGIDHFQNSAGTTANVSIADVEIRAESTGGSSYGIQMNGNVSGIGSFGEVRDATIRSISGGPAAVNYGIRHAAQGEVRYRTTSITLGGLTNWAYGVQSTGGTPRFDDVVIEAVVDAQMTVFGAEIFTPGTEMTNARVRAINTGTGSGHDAVGVKSNGATDVVFRDVSTYAEAETNTWGVDVTSGGSARLVRVDAQGNAGNIAIGARCANGTLDADDSNLVAFSDATTYGLQSFDCSGSVTGSTTFGAQGSSSAFGLYFFNNVATPGEWVVRNGSHVGGTASVRSLGTTVDVLGSTLSGGAGSVANGSVQTCVGVIHDSGGPPTFDAGPTSPCP